MDIIAGLSAVSQALDITKKIRELDQDLSSAEFKLQIAELYSALADTKIALSEAQETIATQEKEIKELKTLEEQNMKTVRYEGFNFGIDDDGRSIGRPFCPICEKTKGLQVQIMRGTARHDLCPSCKGVFSDYPWQLPSDHPNSG